MEYYSAIKRNKIGSSVETWMHLGTVIQSEVSQKEKNKYRILMHGGTSKMVQMNRFAGQKLRHRSREKMYGHRGFPGGAVVESLPANAGDTGSSPGLGRSHMPRSNWACEPQLLSLRVWSLCSATRGRDSERPAHRDEEWSPLAATGESPRTETKTQHSHK